MLAPLVALFACAGSEGMLSGFGEEAPAAPPADAGDAPVERFGTGSGAADTITQDTSGLHGGRDPQPGERMFEAGMVQDLAISLPTDSANRLRTMPSVYVPATLTWKGLALDVSLRIKGSASLRTLDQKPSFKIDVHDTDPDQRIDGLKRLTLNNMIQDRTMLREHAYYWLADRMGMPAPRHGYARVTVDGAPYGLYGIVETEDEQFVHREWPDDDDGNLYEASGADFTSARDWFELEETGDLIAAPDDADGLVATLEGTNKRDFYTTLSSRFDMDDTLTYWAIETVTGNDDGYVFNHHNYRVYHAAVDQRWFFIPWGTDRSFLRDAPPQGSPMDPLVGQLAIDCWASTDCSAALTARIEEVLTVWQNELPGIITDEETVITDDCHADPRRELSCDFSDITNFVGRRAAEVRSAL
jgi:spore coat protein CotH